ncbi:DUF938 domain-containing protein [Rhodovibrionaceae bacterium A322]
MSSLAKDKQTAPAALRNRTAILDVLRQHLPTKGQVLEIASGTGEHAVFFAAALPHLTWQPSELEADRRASVEAYRQEADLPNLNPVVPLDCAADSWPVSQAAAVVCVNLLHISPWIVTEGLFRQAAKILPAGAPLYLYGPYKRNGAHTAPSNHAFDESLRARDPSWGVRNLEEVASVAEKNNFTLAEVLPMPANNFSVIFRKQD